MATRAKRRDPREWLQILEAHERSGLSLRKFAAQRGLNAKTLQYWRSRLRSAVTAQPGFVEVLPRDAAHAEVKVEVNQIRIAGAVSVDQLRALVSGLGC